VIESQATANTGRGYIQPLCREREVTFLRYCDEGSDMTDWAIHNRCRLIVQLIVLVIGVSATNDWRYSTD